ncbi:MFS transporter [Virgibacillus sp. MSJ-26]|uniref:MFS transporter n=1 Tax=Virgibacillus sp. MSJ-26 TaxID=2841522 RepID=UPI001C114D82|nr:MFS transporter [Virgibacillus sp. MSJ-26]MBU5466800.1 MFS transporter [Virgibacillus sp. MSJ-26]
MRMSRLVFPGITMIAVTYGLARFSYGLLLPNISQDLAMSPSISGIISSLFYLSYCFAIVLSTVLTVDKGPRVIVLIAGALAIVGLIIMGVSPNVWVLGFGVLLAGASTGFASPPYGTAITLWIESDKQGSANTWINSGTSIGLVLSGIGAILLASSWRFTYLIYAFIGLIAFIWNAKVLPRAEANQHVIFKMGKLSFKGVRGATLLIISSTTLGISTAVFWTFAIDFIKSTGNYSSWQLPLFWVILGIFGLLGGFSGRLVKQFGLSFTYKWGCLIISAASFLLAWHPEQWSMSYLSAALFGISYIFITGLLMVWGIRVFMTNASLGIGTPFLLLAIGQVIGSLFAGVIIDFVGFAPTFVIYGFMGIISIMLGPREAKSKPVDKINYEH